MSGSLQLTTKKPIKVCVIIKNVDATDLEDLMHLINRWQWLSKKKHATVEINGRNKNET